MTTATFTRHIWLLSVTMSVITRLETDHLVRTEAGMGRDRAMHTAQEQEQSLRTYHQAGLGGST